MTIDMNSTLTLSQFSALKEYEELFSVNENTLLKVLQSSAAEIEQHKKQIKSLPNKEEVSNMFKKYNSFMGLKVSDIQKNKGKKNFLTTSFNVIIDDFKSFLNIIDKIITGIGKLPVLLNMQKIFKAFSEKAQGKYVELQKAYDAAL